MKFAKLVFACLSLLAVSSLVISAPADARNRKYSHRVGGYNSHGKGSHYSGGY